MKTGKIKGLAVTSPARSPALPNVPTLKEAGIKTADVDLRFWFGIFGPKGVPDAVKAKLDKAVSATLAHPRVRERLAKLDVEPAYAPGSALQGEARERDHELEQVHRRAWHQAGMRRMPTRAA